MNALSAPPPADRPSVGLARPWWRADLHAARRPNLVLRNRLRAAIRAFFEERGFMEVETPALQVSPGNETHLHAFATTKLSIDGAVSPLYLRTSPEFACKKLLAAGERRIFELARVYRNREDGPLHHAEFTLLEWYRTGEDLAVLMDDAESLLGLAAQTGGTTRFSFRGRDADPFAPAERLSVADAFMRHAGVDPIRTLDAAGVPDREALATAAADAGVRTAADDTWSDIFSKILTARVEPHLGEGRATILHSYPACEAALARVSPDDPRIALRFEVYMCGVELANAFEELTDPLEQRRRLELEMDEKVRIYGERYPVDDDFLRALEVMAPASGAALGFDRLLLLAAGAACLDDVVWSPPPAT